MWLQAAAPPPACGCAQFSLDAPSAPRESAALSADARSVRDFVLFSHRRIGADLIRGQGPYLQSLLSVFPHCTDEAIKLVWFRQMLASTNDTEALAMRIAHQFDASLACPAPVR
jgi:hypothetical protein